MKIAALALENVKRVKTVRIEPTADGLTILGGKNAQGKTSVLDAITYALGGERMKPTALKREGAISDPVIHIEFDDGLVVERKGKNASLSVTDKDGKRAGQTLLDALVGKIAINLPKFLDASPREKAQTLVDILGIGNKLGEIDRLIKAKQDTRLVVGRERDQKKKAADDMQTYENAPAEEVSVTELVNRSQQILARNGIRESARRRLEDNEAVLFNLTEQLASLQKQITGIQDAIAEAKKEVGELGPEESVDEVKRAIEEHEEINRQVRANREYQLRVEEASDLADHYNNLSKEIEKLREDRVSLINGANLPLMGLSIEDGELVYKGRKFDCWSGAEKMIACTAIASCENPNCKFILLDKLEQMDVDTLKEFDEYLKSKGLQAIGTRVSTGGECTLIIEDGEVAEQAKVEEEY